MEDVVKFWVGFSPQTYPVSYSLTVLLLGVIGSFFLGGLARAQLRKLGAGRYLGAPWLPEVNDENRGIEPVNLAAIPVSLTVWLVAFWWLAGAFKKVTAADFFLGVVVKLWMCTGLIVVAVLLANWLTRALQDFVHAPGVREAVVNWFPAHEGRDEQLLGPLVRLVATVVAGIFLTVSLIGCAEVLNLTGIASMLRSLWELLLRLISVAAALFVGFSGFRLISRPESESEKPEILGIKSAIVAITIVLAIDLLTSATSTFVWLGLLFLIGVLLIPMRGHVLDLWAGLALEYYGIRNVELPEGPVEVKHVEFLRSQVKLRNGSLREVSNRVIMAAHFGQNPPTESEFTDRV